MLIRRSRRLRRFGLGARRRAGYSEGVYSFAKLFASVQDLDEGPRGDERTDGWPRGVVLGESGFVTSWTSPGG